MDATNISRDWQFENGDVIIRGLKSIQIRRNRQFKLSLIGIPNGMTVQPWRSTNDPVLDITESKDHRQAIIKAANVGISRIEVPGFMAIEITVIEDPATVIELGPPMIRLKTD